MSKYMTIKFKVGITSHSFFILIVSVLLLANNCLAQTDSTKGSDSIIFFDPQEAHFPGGQEALNKYLKDNLVYPTEALKERIEGRVILKFIVNRDGKLSDIESIKEGVDQRLVIEAIRLVRLMPRWIPYQQDGRNLATNMILPVDFKLK